MLPRQRHSVFAKPGPTQICNPHLPCLSIEDCAVWCVQNLHHCRHHVLLVVHVHPIPVESELVNLYVLVFDHIRFALPGGIDCIQAENYEIG